MTLVARLLAVTALGSGLAGAASLNLRTGAGQPWSLSGVLGRERVLVVNRPSAAYLAEMRRQDAVLQGYDLRVVALLPPGDVRLRGAGTLMLTLLADPGGRAGAQYGPATLIGKDTGVKARYGSPPSLKTVGTLIDTMPMRQRERRSR
jgi:hypothetical protein